MRLAKSIDQLKASYDAIVVGTGYGGGIAASRLARMGLSVAVLERGREIPVGEFPDTAPEAIQEFQYTLEGHQHGRRTGLFDLHVGRDMHILVGCGLGGTSLINANVSLAPDMRVFEDPIWPHQLFDDATLNEGFKRAEGMLQPKPWPKAHKLAKLDRMSDAGMRLGEELSYPPINVAQEKVINAAGVEQPACTLCGDCCSGCNVGAKSTVQMTYIPDAFNHGAEIFTEVTVRHVQKIANEWRVVYEPTSSHSDQFNAPERSISAKIVVLGAGSLGSTEILLRSRLHGLPVSERLGKGFTGNGDVLAFAWNGQKEVNGVGVGVPPKASAPAPGPCITGALDLRDNGPLGEGMIIEEGVLPSGLAELLPGIFNVGGALFGKPTTSGFLDEFQESIRKSQSWMLGAWQGAMKHTSTFLVMAHDSAAGQLVLDGDHVSVNWPNAASQAVYSKIESKLLEASAANSATYIRNPIQNTFLGKTLVTVHPLGGCGMAQNHIKGVVDHKCRVFDPSQGEANVHEGLFVVDGSAIPRSLGVNPLLTISAIAERAMIHLARDLGRALDVETKSQQPVLRLASPSHPPRLLDILATHRRRPYAFLDTTGGNTIAALGAVARAQAERLKADLGMAAQNIAAGLDAISTANRPTETAPSKPANSNAMAAAGVEFTERMAGYVSRQTSADYATAATAGEAAQSAFSFVVTVRIDNIDAFITNPKHTGRISGVALCPGLSSEPLTVSDGHICLMKKSDDSPDTRLFDYQMTLTGQDGRSYRFQGSKRVHDDHRLTDLWTDTTTLFIDIFDAADASLGFRGILKIAPDDFARQLRTIVGTGGDSTIDRTAAVAKFGILFAGSLYDVYGGIFAPAKRFNPDRARKKRGIRAGTPQVHTFSTDDNRQLRLTRYNANGHNRKGPLLFTHGLGVSSLIFSIDTIDTNLLEYMTDRGYDCWLLDFRASIDLPYHRERWTADDCARFDYQPAVDLIRSVTGASSVQVLAHCFGSTTFVMSVLGGHLQGIRSAVLSQIATDIVVPFSPQRLLAYLRLPSLFEKAGIGTVNARATTEEGLNDRLLDAFIRVAMPSQRDQRSRNATSNRITALYGRLYNIEQLNALTFDSGLPEMFGEANIEAFKHLAELARQKVLVDALGQDTYMPHLDRLSFPITIIHGAENACFLPASTARTMDRLIARNGARFYQRHLIPNYGHIDCIFGKNAASDVYPKILEHFERSAPLPP